MLVSELVAQLGLEVDTKGFNEAIEGFNKLREHIHKVVEIVGVLEGAHILHEWVEQTTETAVQFKHLAERLGTSVEAVQQLGYAADVTGADVQTMQGALQRLQFGMEAAARTSSGPLAEALGKLQIPFGEFKKLKPDEQFARLAEGFKNAPPYVNKTGVAMELFGRNMGPRLIPLLNKGTEGLRELREEFEATGAQLDDQTIEQFEDLEIQQKKLGYTWQGLKNEAVAALLPALKDLVEGVLKWVKANRELIKTGLEKLIHGVAIALKVLGTIFSYVILVIKEIILNWKAMAISLGILTTAFLIIKREAVAAAIRTAIAWLGALAPILLVAAAIAAVVLVVQDLYTWAEGGDSVFKGLYEAFVKYLGDTGVGKVILKVIDGVKWIGNEIIALTDKLINLGHRLGSALAWQKQYSREYSEIKELNPGMKDEEIKRRAEEAADRDVEISEHEYNREHGEGQTSSMTKGEIIDQAVTRVGAHRNYDPWAVKPTVAAKGGQTNHNTMHAQINIHGLEKGGKEVAEEVTRHIAHWWDGMARDTHAATNAGARRP